MDKKELRNTIKTLKKQHTKEQLLEQSEIILSKLEQHPDFQKAHIVMIYSALPDEVQTQAFLEKWRHKKKIILPTVVGDDIIPVELAENTGFAVGDFNILEPQNEPYTGDYDLIVVPGVAFDRNGYRIIAKVENGQFILTRYGWGEDPEKADSIVVSPNDTRRLMDSLKVKHHDTLIRALGKRFALKEPHNSFVKILVSLGRRGIPFQRSE